MNAHCIPCPRAPKIHRDAHKCGASQPEIKSLIGAVRGLPADSRLPEATLLDMVKRHAEHRIAVKHGGNEHQALLKVIWAQVHQTGHIKQIKQGVKMADSLRSLDFNRPSVREATYLLYLSAVGKFNLGDLGEAKKRALKVLSIERDHTRAAILIHLIEKRKHPLAMGWLAWPWYKKVWSLDLSCDT